MDTTATAIVLAPTYATLEHVISGMSKQESQNSRLIGLGLSYIGLGQLISYGRDLYLKAVKVDEDSPINIQNKHDRVYGAIFNAVIGPPFYLAAGIHDPIKIMLGTVSSAIFGYFAQGKALGYALDVSRDFAHIKPSSKTPQFLKSMTGAKKALVPVLAAAASFALTELAWNLPSIYEAYDYAASFFN